MPPGIAQASSPQNQIMAATEYAGKKISQLSSLAKNPDGTVTVTLNRFDPIYGKPSAAIVVNFKTDDLQATAQVLQDQLTALNTLIQDSQ